jgi:hypothetical protein
MLLAIIASISGEGITTTAPKEPSILEKLSFFRDGCWSLKVLSCALSMHEKRTSTSNKVMLLIPGSFELADGVNV